MSDYLLHDFFTGRVSEREARINRLENVWFVSLLSAGLAMAGALFYLFP